MNIQFFYINLVDKYIQHLFMMMFMSSCDYNCSGKFNNIESSSIPLCGDACVFIVGMEVDNGTLCI